MTGHASLPERRDRPGAPAPRFGRGSGLRRLLISGVLFLIPILAILLLVGQALTVARRIFTPLADHVGGPDQIGPVLALALAVLSLLALVVLAGLFARTFLGRAAVHWLEHRVLTRVPVYGFVKSAAEGVVGLSSMEGLTTCLASIEEAWVLAFVIERDSARGLVTVFVPGAPAPLSGAVYFLEAARVRDLDMPVLEAMTLLRQLGRGGLARLGDKLG